MVGDPVPKPKAPSGAFGFGTEFCDLGLSHLQQQRQGRGRDQKGKAITQIVVQSRGADPQVMQAVVDTVHAMADG